MARLRLSITDDPKHQPDGVRVVGRQRFGWVALLAAYAALFCLPAFRNTMVDQAHIVTTGQAPEWLSGIVGTAGVRGDVPDAPYKVRLRKTMEKHPNDVDLHLGAIILGYTLFPDSNGDIVDRTSPFWKPRSDLDARLVYLAELRRSFPGNVPVLATSVRYYSQNTIRIQRPELRTNDPQRPKIDMLLDPGVAAEVLAVISEGEQADPQNAYFPMMAAATLVARGKDDEAVEALSRAARCSFWKDYTWSEGGGAERLLLLTYGDRGVFMHISPLAAVLLPHFSQMRAAYHVLAERVNDTPAGWQLRADMLQVGAMLRDGGDTLIGRLVGASLQDIAFETGGLRRSKDHTGKASEAAKKQQIRKVVERAERQAPTLAPSIGREADRLAEFGIKRGRIQRVLATWEGTMQPAIQRELLGLHLLGNLFGCLALWALGTVVLFAGQKVKWLSARHLHERLSRPAYHVVLALALAALLYPLAMALAGPPATPFGLGIGLVWVLLVVRPLLTRPAATPAWSPLLIGVTASGAVICTLAALWPWEFVTHTTQGFWMQKLGFLHLFGESPAQDATNAVGSVIANPAPLAIFAAICTAVAALRKRATMSGWMEGVQGVARVLMALLAVGYLIFTLVHTPATLRDGRIASQNFRNETTLLDRP